MRFLVVAASLGALSLSLLSHRLAAQTVASNALYLELGGSAGIFSVNYERRISARRLRVGIAKWTLADRLGIESDDYTVVPITLSSVVGDGSHHFETGGGVTLGHSSMTDDFEGNKSSNLFATITTIAGYRYQRPGSGFLFRAVLTPMYGLGREGLAYPARGFLPSGGISFGAAF